METKYFNDGFVGKAVFNANEAIKCFNAGMEIRDTEGEYFLFDSDDSAPSESKSINLILDSLQENGKVYVGFCLEGHKVVSKNSTTLTCEFSEGQTVYFLLQGEIASGEVACISLATNKIIEERGQWYSREALCYGVCDNRERNYNFERQISIIQEIFTKDCVCIDTKSVSRYIYLPLDKVFSTKEELVQDLLSKSC